MKIYSKNPVCTWLLWKTVFKMVFNHPNLLPYFIYTYYYFTPPFQQPLFLLIASFVGFSARFRLVNLSDFPRRQRRIFLGEKECRVGSARPHLQGRFVTSASYRVGLHPWKMVVLETRHSHLGRPIFRGSVYFREGKFFVLKGFFSEWKRCRQLISDLIFFFL